MKNKQKDGSFKGTKEGQETLKEMMPLCLVSPNLLSNATSCFVYVSSRLAQHRFIEFST